MSAADLGRRLLSASTTKNLGEVLSSFQHQFRTPYPSPALDYLFHVDDHPYHGAENQQAPTRKYPVIELCSEESGTGKTQLLYLIVAIAILPETCSSVELEGRNSAVIFLDTEGRFNIQRLAEIMQGYILLKDPTFTNIEDLILRSLQHLHIYQPQSFSALVETLSEIQTYLFTEPENSRRPIHSIIIDSTSAFYWQNRAEEDENTSTSSTTTAQLTNRYATLIHHLRALSHTFKCSIITTSQAFSSFSRETGERTLRTMPAPWASFPTMRLCLSRDQVRKFPAGVNAEEALRERAARRDAVMKAGFSASTFGGRRVFGFIVKEGGVEMENWSGPL